MYQFYSRIRYFLILKYYFRHINRYFFFFFYKSFSIPISNEMYELDGYFIYCVHECYYLFTVLEAIIACFPTIMRNDYSGDLNRVCNVKYFKLKITQLRSEYLRILLNKFNQMRMFDVIFNLKMCFHNNFVYTRSWGRGVYPSHLFEKNVLDHSMYNASNTVF